ncbi:MAG: hypothetical protein ACK5LZ_03475 [Anaerorhabdus sp.]
MEKINIVNRSLISNKAILEAKKLPLWIPILSFLGAVLLTAAPIIIRSNETVETIFQQHPEVIEEIQLLFDENQTCTVSDGVLSEGCQPIVLESENWFVGIAGSTPENISSVMFAEDSLVVLMKENETSYRVQLPYSFDFSFNQVEEKEIISYELVNQMISSAQFANVVNGLIAFGAQCTLYLGVGMISLYSAFRFQAKKKVTMKDLFKMEAMISLSGGLLAFILCFIIDPFVAFAPTIFLFNIIARTFAITFKMKQFTF